RFYLSMIRAAEASGNLGEGLDRLTTYLASSQALRNKVVSALIYPAILLAVAGLSVIILLTAVVPQFRPMFEEMGAALPMPTRIVLAVSDFLAANGWWLPVVLAGMFLLVQRTLASPASRRRIHAKLLGLPVVGSLVQAVDTARFGRSLGTLLSNGVPVLKGLAIARETMSNVVMAEAVDQAAHELREGGHLSRALMEAAVFPGLAMRLLKVGEESGRVDAMMLRVADIYDEEVELTIQRLLAMLEPVLIIGLGVVIAGIIVSVLVGIISINDLPV
ncbi:MAG: type II secretion system F family protein, partial [Gammaproteobacteria bacterium]|nr:type II secretion system F family protein [Gammaproteobacteria bacterium]